MWFFFVRLHEKENKELEQREILLNAYNRACVRSDELGQSTLLNLLLRNYLRHNHIDAAHNLIEKTSFPEGKSNNEFCKYLFYTGRVKAIRR
jgi:26S proteasome regulatory subunit N3